MGSHFNREELAGRLESYSLVAPTRGMSHALSEAAAALRQSPSVEEVAEIIRDKVRIRRSVEWDVASPLEVANASDAAQAIIQLFEGRRE